MGKRLSMRVELLPTIVHCATVIDVGEGQPVRIVETFYCNCTGADRLMYGKGEEGVVHAALVAHLTREGVARIRWEPLEDPAPYDPGEGGC